MRKSNIIIDKDDPYDALGDAIKKIIFTPGPLQVSERVRRAFLKANMFHREPRFTKILSNLQVGLRTALGVNEDYFPCILTATGHGANEAMIIPFILNHKPLFLTNGSWGDTLIKIAKYHKRDILTLECDRQKKIDPRRIDSFLRSHKKVDTLIVVHQETRSGILNPLDEIADIAKRHHCRLIVDAMSSVVIEDISFQNLGVSFFSCGSTKGLRSFPGLGIVCGRRDEFEKLKNLKRDSYYFNIHEEYLAQFYEKKLRFAQSVPLFLALNEAVIELLEEGVDSRRRTIQKRTREFRNWARSHNLQFTFREPELGHVATTFTLPKDVTYKVFRDELSKFGIFVLYGDREEGNQFQISLVGALKVEDILHLKSAILEFLKNYI